MSVSRLLLALLGVCLASAVQEKRYDGYKIIDVHVANEGQAEGLIKLAETFPIQPDGSFRPGNTASMLVSPAQSRMVQSLLKANQISYTVINENVQESIEKRRNAMLGKVDEDFDFDAFNTLADIQAQVERFASDCAAGLSCDLHIGGVTYQGENVQVLRIGNAGGSDNAVLMLSLIHAREWITGATMMKIINHMLTGYGTDDEVTRMLDTYDFYLIPVDNPDGYNNTVFFDRMHRKNMTPNPDSNCIGTDLNRNNDVNWSMEGASGNPCFDTFYGVAPGSEIETQIFNNEILNVQAGGQTLWSVVDMHSYGRMWLHPWGHTVDHEGDVCVRLEDHDDVFGVAEITTEAIMNTHLTTWTYGNSCEVIYATTGGTADWAREAAGVLYPFVPEMRGRGFDVNEDQIQPSFEEIWNGLVAMTDEIARLHNLN